MAMESNGSFGRITAALVVAALGLCGCTLLEGVDGMASPDIQPASGMPVATGVADESMEPEAPPMASAAPESGSPDGSDVPVPDPLHPLHHSAGDPVEIPGGTIVYTGLTRSSDRLVAVFRMASGSLPSGARLATPDGSIVGVTDTGDAILSEAFGDASDPPAPDEMLTLVVGNVLVVFEVGRP